MTREKGKIGLPAGLLGAGKDTSRKAAVLTVRFLVVERDCTIRTVVSEKSSGRTFAVTYLGVSVGTILQSKHVILQTPGP